MIIDGLESCGLLVDYCDVFYQLFGLSFWQHPSIHKWASAVMQKFSKSVMKKKLFYILDGLREREYIFSLGELLF